MGSDVLHRRNCVVSNLSTVNCLVLGLGDFMKRLACSHLTLTTEKKKCCGIAKSELDQEEATTMIFDTKKDKHFP